MRICIQDSQKVEQFDQVNATATALDLRHKRLRSAKSVRYVLLQQSARSAELRQQSGDPLIPRVVNWMGHAVDFIYAYRIFRMHIRYI